jgi:transcriptional regulator with XRE-family HTH domain
MELLPTLRLLRESRGLSQRALAKISGVAHETISQIEQGDRRARSSTAQKLARALDVSPFVLATSIEELASMTEEEVLAQLEDELPDYEARKVFDRLRSFLIEFGFAIEAAWEDSKAVASYEDLLECIDVAYKKLNPHQRTSQADQLVDITEATLLLAQASAQLMRFITRQLEAGFPLDNYLRDSQSPHSYLSTYVRFGSPLVQAWLDGSAATKDFIDITDKASRLYGEEALEDESENGGGDQQE